MIRMVNFVKWGVVNGLQICEESDSEALNLIRSTKLHLNAEPAFLPSLLAVRLSSISLMSVNF